MSVLDVNDTVLSNAEALEVIKFNKEFLDSCTDRRAGYDVSLKEAKWVHKKVGVQRVELCCCAATDQQATTFLNTTPAGSQTRDAARQLLEVLDHEGTQSTALPQGSAVCPDNAYGFTDFEKLQILNLRPHNAVALHTVGFCDLIHWHILTVSRLWKTVLSD